MSNRFDPNYKPKPQSNKKYVGADVPTAYDENWQYFTNLTPNQIAWFQSCPEWQNFLSYVALSPKTASAAAPVSVVNSALQTAGLTVATVAV